MDVKVITLPTDQITDWNSFHSVCKDVFGFPDFYGRNMNAWIDCMTSVDCAEDGMTTVNVADGGLLVIRVDNAAEFKKRCPEEHEALIECAAFVNYRRIDVKGQPVLALMLIGDYPNP
ncbi:MAG: barnase inhibitor [Alphaproteobacteria bacterium]|nr:MAG: barnase inhibitor [Alphaproteobacteria bacterium]